MKAVQVAFQRTRQMMVKEVSAENWRRIQEFRLMDDVFMQVCFRDNLECTELVLRIILSRPDLCVQSVQTQKTLKNLYGRSLCLDITATDSVHTEYDIEIQRADQGALVRRARYHSSLMDANHPAPGRYFERLPESYVIFITEHGQPDEPMIAMLTPWSVVGK